MPLTIRHLPTKGCGQIIDTKNIPEGCTLFNPSRDGKWLYIRNTIHTATGESNKAIMHNMETKETHTIDSPMHLLAPTHNLFTGIEDLRIAEYKGLVWFSGTTTHASNHQRNELIVGHFDEGVNYVERLSVVDIGSRPVKNVCAFVYGDNLCLLDIFKRMVYKLVDNDNKFSVEPLIPLQVPETLKKNMEDLRGSTSPVHLHGNIWGCVVHDIIYRGNRVLVTRLSYIHHWLEFDISTGQITYLSTPFFIKHWGIEYVSGMAVDRDERGQVTTVHLYFGIEDRIPYSCATTLTDLKIGY